VLRMWKCPGCGEAVDDHFDICWKCGDTKPEVTSAEYLGTRESGSPEDLAQEGSTRGIGFFRWRNHWITVPLGLLLLFVAFGLGYNLFELMFRGASCPR
jgi:hypothetical protein